MNLLFSKFKLFRWIVIGLIAVIAAWFFSVDVELMIRNQSGEKIKIISCALNGKTISGCEQELPNEQAAFFNPHHFIYPKNNNFYLKIGVNDEIKEFSCNFMKASRECTAEMALTKDGFECASECTSIY